MRLKVYGENIKVSEWAKRTHWTVRDKAWLVLEETKRGGYREIMEEVTDRLVDLEFSIEEY